MCLKLGDFYKGLSYTFLVVETIEPRFARWTVGAEATLVGLPPNVEFEEYGHTGVRHAPKGYVKAMKESPEADATYWTYHTYLDWNYKRDPYDGADGTQGGSYGPSSHHGRVVNHLSADNSVGCINKDVDVTMYMYFIARAFEYSY